MTSPRVLGLLAVVAALFSGALAGSAPSINDCFQLGYSDYSVFIMFDDGSDNINTATYTYSINSGTAVTLTEDGDSNLIGNEYSANETARSATAILTSLADSTSYLNGASVTISSDQGSSCSFTWRLQSFTAHSVTVSSQSDWSHSLADLDVDSVGFESVPTGYEAYTQSGELNAVELSFDNSGSTIRYGKNTGSSEGAVSFGGALSSVTIYKDSSDFYVCGIQFDGGDIHGCSSNAETFNFDNVNEGFAFFSQMQDPNNQQGDFFLFPFGYTLYHPIVRQYRGFDDHVEYTLGYPFTFTDVTLDFVYLGQDWGEGFLLESFSVSETEARNDELIYESFSPDIPCFPTSLVATVDQLGAVGRSFDRVYVSFEPFGAWTTGYESSPFTIAGNVNPSGSTVEYDGYPYYYVSNGFDSQCMEVFPERIGFLDGTLFVQYSEQTLSLGPGDVNDIDIEWSDDFAGARFDTFTLYYDTALDVNNNAYPNAIVGATISGFNSESYTVGSTSADTSVEFTDDDRYISGFDVFYSGSNFYNINVYISEPHAPQLVQWSYVSDPLSNAGWTSTLFSPHWDGDLIHYHWYDPVTFSSIKAQVTGFFLKDFDETFFLTAVPSMERGDPAGTGATFYHLIADTTYTVDLWGVESIAGQWSLVNATVSDTPNAVQVACSQDGDFDEQIEFEAIPEPFICIYEDGSTLTLRDDGDTAALTSADADDSQLQYPNDEYFYYDDNDEEYPKYPDFFGYPINVYVYWDDNAFTSDDCLRGLGIQYQNRDSSDFSTVWLAGSQDGYDNTDSASRSSNSLNNQLVTAVYAEGSSCYTGIRFTDDDVFDSGCIGPGASCTTLVSDAPSVTDDPAYYLYSLGVSYNANDNNHIHSVQPKYAAVDIPNLQQLSDSCVLTREVNWNYVRNSYWWFSNDIGSDNLVCGTVQSINDHNSDTRQYDGALGEFFDHEVLYTQRVMRVRDDETNFQLTWTGVNVEISRQNLFHVNSYCYYDAEGVVTSSFGTIAEDPLSRTGVSTLGYVITIFTDSTYNTAYGEDVNPTLFIGEPVYAMVQLVDEIETLIISAYTCWATESDDPDATSYWTLVDDTCPVDETYERTDPEEEGDRDDAFKFDAFAFSDNGVARDAATVWLHCLVTACPESDTEACDVFTEDECNVNRRSRRDVQDFDDIIVSNKEPLIFVNRRHAETMVEGDPIAFQNAQRTFAGTFAFLVTGLVCLTLFVARKVYKARRDYYLQAEC